MAAGTTHETILSTVKSMAKCMKSWHPTPPVAPNMVFRYFSSRSARLVFSNQRMASRATFSSGLSSPNKPVTASSGRTAKMMSQ